jgi:hypothetical protein
MKKGNASYFSTCNVLDAFYSFIVDYIWHVQPITFTKWQNHAMCVAGGPFFSVIRARVNVCICFIEATSIQMLDPNKNKQRNEQFMIIMVSATG